MKLTVFLLWASSLFAAPAVEPTLTGQTYRIDQPWRAQQGDDPRWAAADFDDSAWGSAAAISRPDGYVWYRQKVKLPPLDGPVAVWVPRVLSAAEFFVNGAKVAEYGTPEKWWTHRRSVVPPFLLPEASRRGSEVVLAIRVRQIPSGPGMPDTAAIGSPATIGNAYTSAMAEVWSASVFTILVGWLSLLTGLVALLYWRGKRDRLEYAWFALICLNYFSWSLVGWRAVGATQAIGLLASWGTTLGVYGSIFYFAGARRTVWGSPFSRLLLGWTVGVLVLGFLAGSSAIPNSYFLAIGLVYALVPLAINIQDVQARYQGGDWQILWLFVPFALTRGANLYPLIEFLIQQIGGTKVGTSGRGAILLAPIRVGFADLGVLATGGAMTSAAGCN